MAEQVASRRGVLFGALLLVFPEAGHWILRGEDSRYWYGELHGWLEKYLK